MKPVILFFFFFPLRRILHQNTDFLFEETGGFGIGPVSALTRMGMTFQKPNGKGPGDTAALCPKTPASPQLSPPHSERSQFFRADFPGISLRVQNE